METKMVEIRDSGTTIAALAIKMTGANVKESPGVQIKVMAPPPDLYVD